MQCATYLCVTNLSSFASSSRPTKLPA